MHCSQKRMQGLPGGGESMSLLSGTLFSAGLPALLSVSSLAQAGHRSCVWPSSSGGSVRVRARGFPTIVDRMRSLSSFAAASGSNRPVRVMFPRPLDGVSLETAGEARARAGRVLLPGDSGPVFYRGWPGC